MSSGSTAQDKSWKEREQGAEAQYIREKEKEQYAQMKANSEPAAAKEQQKKEAIDNGTQRDIEEGYGGQEGLEDRYASTYGMH